MEVKTLWGTAKINHKMEKAFGRLDKEVGIDCIIMEGWCIFFLNSERFFLFLVNFFEDFLINDSLVELEAALVDGANIRWFFSLNLKFFFILFLDKSKASLSKK